MAVSIQTFLSSSLPPGPQGIQGVQGTYGSGSQGTQGIQGVQGLGIQGAQGVQGVAGASSSPGGSTTQLQYNNGGAFAGTSGITTTGTELGIASGTKTASAPILDLSQTWNNAAVTFTGLKLNIANTASGAGSLLADLQQNGTSIFSVVKSTASVLSDAAASLSFTSNSVNLNASRQIYLNAGSGWPIYINSSVGIRMAQDSGAITFGATNDLILARDSANTLAQRNSTAPQTFRLYNTYSDDSNYERVSFSFSSNEFLIKPENLGSGTQRNVFYVVGSDKLRFSGRGIAYRYSTETNDRCSVSFGNHIGDPVGLHPGTSSQYVYITAFNSASSLFFNWDRNSGSNATFSIAVDRSMGGGYTGPGDNLVIRAGNGLHGSTSYTGGNLYLNSGLGINGGANGDVVVGNTSGNLVISDARNLLFGSSTGSKIGAATSQKLAFWNATPIVQPTTGISSATFTENSGTTVNSASTFDGYTLAQVVKALRDTGLLA